MPQVIVLDSHIWFWWINIEHRWKLIENGKWRMENDVG
jgi:PIN domain nuclease of toxin-antitoxin system